MAFLKIGKTDPMFIVLWVAIIIVCLLFAPTIKKKEVINETQKKR